MIIGKKKETALIICLIYRISITVLSASQYSCQYFSHFLFCLFISWKYSSATEAPSVKASHHTRSNSDFTDQPAPPSPTSTDGWGDAENGISEGHESDKDGWDLEPLDEPKPSPALANIQAAQKRPVSQSSRPSGIFLKLNLFASM